ncbi:MAG TPA: hypothetical protein IAB22_10405 [Candidatus Merdivicinus intestinavium]|nr:hypothetical protein [Candidatus Merdivicinus intestinavium]
MTIRKKAGLAVLAAALFAAAALLAWRLWPHSLENITQIDSSRYTGVSAVLLADDDDMIPGGDFYSLPRSREHLEPILKSWKEPDTVRISGTFCPGPLPW